MSERRRRRRSIGVSKGEAPPTKKQPSEKLRELAHKFFLANREQNNFAKQAREAKADLMSQMQEEDIKSFVDHECNISVALYVPERQVVDVEVLRKFVDEETFMRIVSASQKAVKEEVGQTTLNHCLKPTKGNLSVSVKGL